MRRASAAFDLLPFDSARLRMTRDFSSLSMFSRQPSVRGTKSVQSRCQIIPGVLRLKGRPSTISSAKCIEFGSRRPIDLVELFCTRLREGRVNIEREGNQPPYVILHSRNSREGSDARVVSRSRTGTLQIIEMSPEVVPELPC